jgi:hypothetical protein
MRLIAAVALAALCTVEGRAQDRPDFSGVWQLNPTASQMVGAGGRVGPGPQDRRISWIIAHRDPRISVTVDVRDSASSREFSFACTTNGVECLVELPELREVRRMRLTWLRDTLSMAVKAQTPYGKFDATDRLYLIENGDVMIFDRVVRDDRGIRNVRQVFRRMRPRADTVAPLPSVALPVELSRVLRDYERHWRTGNAAALSELFTFDGFIARRGGWIRGREAIREAYAGVGSDLRLRAVGFAVADTVGYIVGAYGYGDAAATRDTGRFILALRRRAGQQWLIAADLDGTNR